MTVYGSEEIWSRVRRLFGRDEETPKPPRVNPPSHPRAAPSSCPPEHVQRAASDFERRVTALLRSQPTRDFIVAGKVGLIDIGPIRDRLGTKWPKFEERVHFIVEETLRSRLGAKDMFTRYTGDSYIILFGDSNATEAKLKSVLIAQEITKKFFGADEHGHDMPIGVQTIVATMDGNIARKSIDPIRTMTEALEGTERVQAALHGRGRIGQHALTPEEVQALLGHAEQRIEALEHGDTKRDEVIVVQDHARHTLRQLRDLEEAISTEDKSWTPLCGPAKPEALAQASAPENITWNGETVEPIKVIQDFVRRVEGEVARREEPVVWIRDTHEERCDAPEITFSYLPMWDVGKKRTWLYLCQAAMRVEGTSLACGALTGGNPDSDFVDIIDRLALRRAKSALEDSSAKGLTSMIAVPVHYSSLGRLSPSEQYLRICHAIPNSLRRLLIWEAVRVPQTTWKTQLPQALEPLRRVGRPAFLRLDPIQVASPEVLRDLSHLTNAGIKAVGLNLDAAILSETEAMQQLTTLAEHASKHGLVCYAHGLASLKTVEAATRLGFDFLSGGVIGKALEAPQGVVANSPFGTQAR